MNLKHLTKQGYSFMIYTVMVLKIKQYLKCFETVFESWDCQLIKDHSLTEIYIDCPLYKPGVFYVYSDYYRGFVSLNFTITLLMNLNITGLSALMRYWWTVTTGVWERNATFLRENNLNFTQKIRTSQLIPSWKGR